MVEPSLLLSIATSTDPVLISGDRSEPLSFETFDYPTEIPDVQYPPRSLFINGNTPIGATLPNTAMGGTLRAEGATEAELRANVERLRAALRPLTYNATLTVNGAASDTWSCVRGALAPLSRDYADLRRLVWTFTLTIPVQPIPVGA